MDSNSTIPMADIAAGTQLTLWDDIDTSAFDARRMDLITKMWPGDRMMLCLGLDVSHTARNVAAAIAYHAREWVGFPSRDRLALVLRMPPNVVSRAVRELREKVGLKVSKRYRRGHQGWHQLAFSGPALLAELDRQEAVASSARLEPPLEEAAAHIAPRPTPAAAHIAPRQLSPDCELPRRILRRGQIRLEPLVEEAAAHIAPPNPLVAAAAINAAATEGSPRRNMRRGETPEIDSEPAWYTAAQEKIPGLSAWETNAPKWRAEGLGDALVKQGIADLLAKGERITHPDIAIVRYAHGVRVIAPSSSSASFPRSNTMSGETEAVMETIERMDAEGYSLAEIQAATEVTEQGILNRLMLVRRE